LLDSENLSNENLVLVYPELYRESADVLQEAGLFDEALMFYRVLASMPDLLDTSLHLQMGKCYLMGRYNTEAEECFQKAIDIDNANIEARIQLAKLYEELDLQEQAFIYVSEIMDLRRQQISKQNKRQTQDNTSIDKEVMMRARVGPKSYYKPKRLVDPAERQRQEASTATRLQEQYSMMRLRQRAMRSGDEAATTAWMEAAGELIEDFRSFKTFYPWDKYIHFRGYTGGGGRGQSQTGATPLDDDLAKMADRISHRG
jgi:general transcription factor 3C polypeptide 3 (transcription factor C subunit 4)